MILFGFVFGFFILAFLVLAVSVIRFSWRHGLKPPNWSERTGAYGGEGGEGDGDVGPSA